MSEGSAGGACTCTWGLDAGNRRPVCGVEYLALMCAESC